MNPYITTASVSTDDLTDGHWFDIGPDHGFLYFVDDEVVGRALTTFLRDADECIRDCLAELGPVQVGFPLSYTQVQVLTIAAPFRDVFVDFITRARRGATDALRYPPVFGRRKHLDANNAVLTDCERLLRAANAIRDDAPIPLRVDEPFMGHCPTGVYSAALYLDGKGGSKRVYASNDHAARLLGELVSAMDATVRALSTDPALEAQRPALALRAARLAGGV